MTHCLFCFNPIYLKVTWSNVIQLAKRRKLCTHCEADLIKITGKICRVCSRMSPDILCYDCQRWQVYYNGDDPLQRNISIYIYNDMIKELISRWKYRGDYTLGHVFQSVVSLYFTQYFKSKQSEITVVPIPLSDTRLMERGFNQAEMLAQFISAQQSMVLQRQFSEKQSKKTRKERLISINPFKLQKPINIPVLLVDDIYTTGRTLRHAAELLKEAGCPAVYALTLCRG